MISIRELEKELREHIIFVYNHLHVGDKSRIDDDLINQLYEKLKKLNEYERINIILQTAGGNLASGTKLISLLKEMYSSYEVTILTKCSSTGTFIALGSDKINVTSNAIITPCEPQMTYEEDNLSISLVRNIIENYHNVINIINKVDPKIIGNYYATINYFKDICYQAYDKERADLVIDYMLNKVNSHQYPMSFDEIRKLDIPVIEISGREECYFYEEYTANLLKEFEDVKLDDRIESRLTLISDRENTTAHCKRYVLKDERKHKIFDDYRVIERR